MGSVKILFYIELALGYYINYIKGQLNLARFRGDTAFGLASRLLSTFL